MSIRNYNAFLREVKKKHGITHKQAQSTYRRISRRLDRPAIGRDVKRHPRLTKQAAHPRRIGGGPKTPGKKTAKRVVKSIAEWKRLYREDAGVDLERVVSSADYGRKGRK